MKKLTIAALIVAVGFTLGSLGYAAWWGPGYGPGAGAQVNIQALKSFQKETLPLRDELVTKQLELRNEYAKDNPDQNRIAALEKEMIDLRTKIETSAEKHALPDWGPGWMMGRGGWGHGYMMGRGYGYGYGPRGQYGSGNCPMW